MRIDHITQSVMFIPFRHLTNKGAIMSVAACVTLAIIYEDMTAKENLEKERAKQRAATSSVWQQIADGEKRG